MNTVFKLAIFFLIVNACTGIMLEIIPTFQEEPEYSGKLPPYSESYITGFTLNMSTDVSTGGDVTSNDNWIDRVLDVMNIGFIQVFLTTVDKYLFGFIQVMENMFGGLMTDSLRTVLFGGLRTLITLSYMISAFTMWTTKDPVGE